MSLTVSCVILMPQEFLNQPNSPFCAAHYISSIFLYDIVFYL
jgi:hypothetical protein